MFKVGDHITLVSNAVIKDQLVITYLKVDKIYILKHIHVSINEFIRVAELDGTDIPIWWHINLWKSSTIQHGIFVLSEDI
jgi:hypothetical protein